MQFTQEHEEIRRTLRTIIDKDINPLVDKWEEEGIFPAHEVFKKLGNAGLLGINKPVEYGGMGLDYSYAMVMAEELGHINCGSVPMAIGVQTDMATPALARLAALPVAASAANVISAVPSRAASSRSARASKSSVTFSLGNISMTVRPSLAARTKSRPADRMRASAGIPTVRSMSSTLTPLLARLTIIARRSSSRATPWCSPRA